RGRARCRPSPAGGGGAGKNNPPRRNVDVVMVNTKWPSPQVLGRYAQEHKEPLAPGQLPDHSEMVGGEFWTSEIARHDRPRLAYAVWSVLSRRLLAES